MSRLHFPIALAGIVILVSCSDDAVVGPASTPFAPSFAKAPPVSDPTATFAFPLDDAALSLKSDGLFATATHSVYANGVCGVSAKVFATTAASNSGDATMQTNNPTASDRKCASYPRTMTIAYSDGVTETIPVFMNLRQLQNTTVKIAIGDSVRRGFAINPPQRTRCDILRWINDGVSALGDSVWVRREAADRWHVWTAAGEDKAQCTTSGIIYNMPVDFTITTNVPLP